MEHCSLRTEDTLKGLNNILQQQLTVQRAWHRIKYELHIKIIIKGAQTGLSEPNYKILVGKASSAAFKKKN